MDAKIYRLALVRPVGKFKLARWNDFPRECVIMQIGGNLVTRSFAEEYIRKRNAKLRRAGRGDLIVVIRPGKAPHAGDFADQDVPTYACEVA